MELHQFKTILLEFLEDITDIPKWSRLWFLDAKDAKDLFDAPLKYKVFSPYILARITTANRISKRPTPIIDENDDIEGNMDTEIYYCRIEFKIFTEAHEFHISAAWKEYHASYLGCITNTRKYRPGENWFRGNDLPDGYFCKDTWDRIKNRIIKYEIKALSKQIAHGHYQNAEGETEDSNKKSPT